jgi:hypothetical protein
LIGSVNTPGLPSARSHHSIAATETSIVVAGGWLEDLLRDTWRFDLGMVGLCQCRCILCTSVGVDADLCLSIE